MTERASSGAPQGPHAATAPRARILRIGVLLDGKIVEEKLIREHISVSIGQSMKNTFSVPVEGLPLDHTLFVYDNHRYFLRFLPRMDGRLSDSGTVSTLEQLKAGGAQQGPGYWQVQLSPQARGKLSLGDLTILFQFVTEPPRQPRPMLPASVRTTFADWVDPLLLLCVGISLAVFTLITLKAYLTDRENDDSIAERAYNLVFKPDEYTVQLDQPKPTPEKTPTGSAAAAATEKKPVERPAPHIPVERPAPNPKAAAEAAAAKQKQADENALALASIATAEGPNGNIAGNIAGRRPGGDLENQLAYAKANNKQVGIGGNDHGPRDAGNGHVGNGQGLHVDAPGGTETAGGGHVERAPTGRIAVADKSASDTDVSLTADAVVEKIKSLYMNVIQRCYNDYLKKDASARGRITLAFTVNPTGRAVKGKATGFNDEVDTCVTGKMAHWTFPAPKDKDGSPTDADFQVTLQLVPD